MAHTLADSLRCEVPVLFASTEGQTALIAIRLAAVLPTNTASTARPSMCPRRRPRPSTGAACAARSSARRYTSAGIRSPRRDSYTLMPRTSTRCRRRSSRSASSAASKNRHEVEEAERIAKAFPAAHGWKPSHHPVGGRTTGLSRIQLPDSIRDQTHREEGRRTDGHEPRPRADELGGGRSPGPGDGHGDSARAAVA